MGPCFSHQNPSLPPPLLPPPGIARAAVSCRGLHGLVLQVRASGRRSTSGLVLPVRVSGRPASRCRAAPRAGLAPPSTVATCGQCPAWSPTAGPPVAKRRAPAARRPSRPVVRRWRRWGGRIGGGGGKLGVVASGEEGARRLGRVARQ